MNLRECKRCLLKESSREDVYKSIQEILQKLSDAEKTDEQTYAQRLSACQGCEQLVSGVCLKCGCYVELRAAYKRQKCPHVKDRRWNAVT